MRVIQCEKGHYYDSEKYAECPVCLKLANKSKDEKIKTEKIEEINPIDFTLLKECEEVTQILIPNESSNEPHTTKPEELDIDKDVSSHFDRPDDDGVTQVSFWNNSVEECDENMPNFEITNPDDNEMTQVFSGISNNVEKVKRITKSMYKGPVVGWLVAIKGPHLGQSFELYAKKNYIGRNDNNIVCLSLDKTVSRTSPLAVIFDSKKCEFIAMAGNSDQTAYINDQLVLQPIKLDANDCIVIGNTSLLFVPFITQENSLEKIYKIGK